MSHPPEPLSPDPRAATRRAFLGTIGGVAAAPGILALAGCGGKPPGPPATAPGTAVGGEHVLKASRFEAAPDGRPRRIMGYNGRYPGPEIRVKEGELLRVRVVNDLDVPTSVHWHGMHQPGTWQMDGVENVSRPPIPPGQEFVYEFRATPPGTHWYHSHVGVQYGDGLFGPLIVEEATPVATYDRDLVVFVNDWFLDPAEVLLARLVKGKDADAKPPTEGANGPMPGMKPGAGKTGVPGMKGMSDNGDVPFESALINGKGRGPDQPAAPLSVFEVKPGETVRLRLINSSSTYAFRFQVDDHPLTVVAADGAPVKPVPVDNLVIGVGERYDVLLKADKGGTSWVRAATLDGDETRAVLKYPDATPGKPADRPVKWGERMLMPTALKSPQPVRLPDAPREMTFTLGGTMSPFRWHINGQYYPKADPVILKKDEPVRFVLNNPTGMDHPFHLHGHYFHVLGKPGALNLTDPPQKDTVVVPAKGGVAIQWVATNPGKWFFHCHIEWHIATGMGRVIEIRDS